MNYPVIILGAGGHAKALIDILLMNNTKIIGITVSKESMRDSNLYDIPIIGYDEKILDFSSDSILLINGIGTTRSELRRKIVFEHFMGLGYQFGSVIHPSSIISKMAKLSKGVQVMAGSVIQIGSSIGSNTIINTKASVDHDCKIGNHVHIAPGVTLSGGVVIGENSHIGTGATVIQNIKIGENATIAAGSVVIRNIPNNKTVKGVPAK